MELNDFITTAFKQLIDGVIEAQNYAKDKGAFINPILYSYSGDNKIVFGDNGEIVQVIDFDIAITTAENEKHGGGVGVNIEVLKVGYKGSSDFSTSEVSRIKFSIPIMLPEGTAREPRDHSKGPRVE